MAYRIIDMENYARRQHFNYFRSLPYPYVGITADVDVTDLLKYCKAKKRSFYLMFIHAVALAADKVPELRQRIHGNQIIEYSECPTSHIELLEDGSYCYCTLYHHLPLKAYYSEAEKARTDCKAGSITEDEAVESMYFISTLPWLHYTAMVQPVAGSDESNPRITWGKYEENDKGRYTMPVTILAHHALVDGIHIARFYRELKDAVTGFFELDE